MNDKTTPADAAVAPPSATIDPKKSFRSLAILAASNEGVKTEIKANGTVYTLTLVSQWSDKFYLREAELGKQASSGAGLPDARMVRLDMLAALIVGWDFDEELTLDNAKEFLTVAPQIADYVEKFTSNAGNFYRS